MKVSGSANRKVRIIGHRGAAGLAVENSLEAFETAFDHGVDGIELDVKFLHGKLMVFHDDTLDRVTNTAGPISSLTEQQLSQVRLLNGEPIPTLADVWDITPPDVFINVELKGRSTGKPTAEFIRTHSHRYLLSSFIFDELRESISLRPETTKAILMREPSSKAFDTAAELQAQYIHLWDKFVDSELVNQCLNAGLQVSVFTVNESTRANELIAMGVSTLFTDVPGQLLIEESEGADSGI